MKNITKMTSIKNTVWLEKYLGKKIITGKTQLQDILILLAKKIDKLEKKKNNL